MNLVRSDRPALLLRTVEILVTVLVTVVLFVVTAPKMIFDAVRATAEARRAYLREHEDGD